jgi:exopolysaccharide biosynthesis polyprenyl glycosylphosphotransferase
MLMPSDTINDTTWAGVSAPPRKISLRVGPYPVARTRTILLAAELATISAALLEALWRGKTFEVPILIAFCAITFHWKALDKSIAGSDASRFWRDFVPALGWGICAGTLILSAFPATKLRTEAYFSGLLLAGLLPVVLRPVLRHLIADEELAEGMLIVGSGDLAAKLHQALVTYSSTSRPNGAGALLRFPEFPGDETDFSRLPDILLRDRISRVIVAEQNTQNRTMVAQTLVAPRLRGLLVNDAVDFCEQFFGKIWIDALSSEWFVYTSGFNQSKAGIFLKRCFDIFFALLLLILTAPVLLLVAIAIRVDSGGPILFRQVRVGMHGRPFVIYKFRSMRHEDASAPRWATAGDQRVTRVGRLLRKFRLDEIPQAVNVLRGEMSLVGPRPEQPYFVNRLAEEIPFYNLRHFVKPGITGWAQVMYRYGASVEDACEKLQYDLYYAKHRSCGFDFKILLKTVKIVTRGMGL